MLDGAVVIPLQELFYNLIFQGTALMWIINRALLIVAYFLMAITGWITEQVFAPLLTIVGDQTSSLIGPVFSIAMGVLAMTYILAVFGRFHVVSMRRAVLWLLFAAALYTFGPNFYTGMEAFRREIAAAFYEVGVSTATGGSAVAGLDAVGSTDGDAMRVPTDQLGVFLPIASVQYVDGVDVALAYIDATGYDLLGNNSTHRIGQLPWVWIDDGADGYFDPDTGPTAFNSMNESQRSEAIGLAFQGLSRMTTALLISIMAIVEQIIHFLLACSFAIAFISMFVATMFAFFIRTEPIASSALEMVIELFIQTLINSLLISLIIGFVLIAANTGNGILLLGGSIAALFMAWNLMQGTFRALTSSTDRLFKSFASATGGNFATAAETRQSVTEATIGAATGAAVLAGGGSFLQAAGATLGDGRTAQTMNYATRMLGGDDTFLGRAADEIGQGAAARTIGGPVGGALLGADNRRRAQEDEEREARLSYLGENDTARGDAVSGYRETLDRNALADSFDDADAGRVQALALAFDDDDFDTVTETVQRTRNANPGLSPSSAAFQGQVRAQLPPDLQTIDAAALGDFAELFGDAADPSAYQKAADRFAPVAPRGALDQSRDDAVSAYRGTGADTDLTDAFSTEDANRVARLVDNYSEDDFDAVVSAVRTGRDADPDQTPGTRQALSATRQALPPGLNQMPSADLRAFSLAFGGSPVPTAVSDDERSEPTIYTGSQDDKRDAAVAEFRRTDNDTALDEVFDPRRANEVMTLAYEYGEEEFDAAVRAVRQARTDDPDMEPGSSRAVRAARQNLPDEMRQMNARDLQVFSEAFGDAAELSAAPSAKGSVPTPARRRQREGVVPFNRAATVTRLEREYPHDFDTLADTARAVHAADPNLDAGSGDAVAAIRAQLPEHLANTPFSDLQQFSRSYNDDLTTVSGIGPSEQVQLRGMGITSIDDLARANSREIAEKTEMDTFRSSAMVATARDIARVDPLSQPTTSASAGDDIGRLNRLMDVNDDAETNAITSAIRASGGDTPTSDAPVAVSTNATTDASLPSQTMRVNLDLDLTALDGIGKTIQSRLNGIGINSVGDLANASPDDVASVRGVSATRAAALVTQAQQMTTGGTGTDTGNEPLSGPASPIQAPVVPASSSGGSTSRRRDNWDEANPPPRDYSKIPEPPDSDVSFAPPPAASGRRSRGSFAASPVTDAGPPARDNDQEPARRSGGASSEMPPSRFADLPTTPPQARPGVSSSATNQTTSLPTDAADSSAPNRRPQPTSQALSTPASNSAPPSSQVARPTGNPSQTVGASGTQAPNPSRPTSQAASTPASNSAPPSSQVARPTGNPSQTVGASGTQTPTPTSQTVSTSASNSVPPNSQVGQSAPPPAAPPSNNSQTGRTVARPAATGGFQQAAAPSSNVQSSQAASPPATTRSTRQPTAPPPPNSQVGQSAPTPAAPPSNNSQTGRTVARPAATGGSRQAAAPPSTVQSSQAASPPAARGSSRQPTAPPPPNAQVGQSAPTPAAPPSNNSQTGRTVVRPAATGGSQQAAAPPSTVQSSQAASPPATTRSSRQPTAPPPPNAQVGQSTSPPAAADPSDASTSGPASRRGNTDPLTGVDDLKRRNESDET